MVGRAIVVALLLLASACGSTEREGGTEHEGGAEPAVDTAASASAESAEPAAEPGGAASASAESAEPSLEPTAEPAVDSEAAEPGIIEYGDRWPEVLAVEASMAGDGAWRFSVTLSSTYDTPQRYADAWRVLNADDVELGVRVLAHDHANEQPFTRSHTIEVPIDTTVVFVEGRDQENGWSGQRFVFELPS